MGVRCVLTLLLFYCLLTYINPTQLISIAAQPVLDAEYLVKHSHHTSGRLCCSFIIIRLQMWEHLYTGNRVRQPDHKSVVHPLVIFSGNILWLGFLENYQNQKRTFTFDPALLNRLLHGSCHNLNCCLEMMLKLL